MARDGTKTGGRTKGSINKKTAEELDRAGRVLELIESKYLKSDIAKLSPHQRMVLYSDMMEYKAPKLQRTTHVGDEENPIAHKFSLDNLENIPTETLLKILDGRTPK